MKGATAGVLHEHRICSCHPSGRAEDTREDTHQVRRRLDRNLAVGHKAWGSGLPGSEFRQKVRL